MSNLLSNLLAAKHRASKTKNRDAAIAFNNAIKAWDRDDVDSLNFWVRQGAICIEGMFDKAKHIKPITAEGLALYKKEIFHESRVCA